MMRCMHCGSTDRNQNRNVPCCLSFQTETHVRFCTPSQVDCQRIYLTLRVMYGLIGVLMDASVHRPNLTEMLLPTISLFSHFMSLHTEYLRWTNDRSTPDEVVFSTLLFHQEKGYDAPILCLMEHVAPYLRHRDLSSSFEFSQVVEETESFIPDEYRAVVGLRCGHDLVVGQPRGCEVDVGAASVVGDADDESFGSGGGVAGEAAGGVDERAAGEQPAGEAGREGVCVHGAGGGE